MEATVTSKTSTDNRHPLLPQYLEAIPYSEYKASVPTEGRHLLASYDAEKIVVYQAYSPAIAEAAVKTQHFYEGSGYKVNRMSWIKPNFLWMMFRSGWAAKQNQERILSIRLPRENFLEILRDGVFAMFKEVGDLYARDDRQRWEEDLKTHTTRIQWDPDHTPRGSKTARRAIQLGIKEDIRKKFATEWDIEIDDITEFVQEQREHVEEDNLEALLVISEQSFEFDDLDLKKKVGLP
eukprot:CAMPEP_0115008092 /NCGR_PEP_ID=MMETSP0216-20121206/21668_1 /TAXON_ID=223996 /ORGANISM="Protocruzia adherens, Strain Boccale" /LENGTH=236 /DNA_ID=CAMNT_0002375357 /DNA_START=101 /DNA_END=811 /DNA_ORIENTATION=-